MSTPWPLMFMRQEPQTLVYAITEVEKLQATQQLTATLLPSSTVNVMSHEEDRCFQMSRVMSHSTSLSICTLF